MQGLPGSTLNDEKSKFGEEEQCGEAYAKTKCKWLKNQIASEPELLKNPERFYRGLYESNNSGMDIAL